jgi:hypothetical protein
VEDYGWLVFVAIFWVLSTVGEFRKKGKARRRDGADAPERRGSRPDPAASGRELAGDVDAAARQAEEALLRWEARQRELGSVAAGNPTGSPPARVRATARPQAPAAPADMKRQRALARRKAEQRRREVAAQRADEEERRVAYEAIAGMLSPQPEVAAAPEEAEGSATWKAGVSRQPDITHTGARPGAAGARRSHSPSPARRPAAASGLARLDALPAMQRAIVLSEILGPPKALG